MNIEISAQDLDPTIHGSLLRLIKGEPEPQQPEEILEPEPTGEEYREAPSLRAGDLSPSLKIKRDCNSCASHDEGWCYAFATRTFYNIKFLRGCPLENDFFKDMFRDVPPSVVVANDFGPDTFARMFKAVIEELAENYREGTRDFLRQYHPDLMAELQQAADAMPDAWSKNDPENFPAALERWRQLQFKGIELHKRTMLPEQSQGFSGQAPSLTAPIRETDKTRFYRG